MEKVAVHITNLAPLVLTDAGSAAIMTGTQTLIAGKMLRGILAQRYIDQQKLGENAHRNEDFRRLFFGSLRFVDAMPAGENWTRSIVLPLSLQRGKSGTKEAKTLQDLLKPHEDKAGLKPMRGLGLLAEGKIQPISVKTSIHLHMSRTGEGERLKGRSENGQLYNYESIDANQRFVGEIIGEAADLKILKKALGKTPFTCQIGRSKYTQYGTCTVELKSAGAIDVIDAADMRENSLLLRLDTPCVTGRGGSAENQVKILLEELAKATGNAAEDYQLGQVFSAASANGSFVGIWSMRRPEEEALAAGTVCEISKSAAWTEAELAALTEICYRGIGRHAAEGFGQLRPWPWQEMTLQENAASSKIVFGKADKYPEEVVWAAKSIIEKRIGGQIGSYAAKDADKLRNVEGKASFFSRLGNDFLERAAKLARYGQDGAAGKVRDELKKLLDAEPDNSSFKSNLFNTFMDGISLKAYLTELDREQPYVRQNWLHDLQGKEEKFGQLLEELGLKGMLDDIRADRWFYVYWQWLCRCARKKAAAKKAGE